MINLEIMIAREQVFISIIYCVHENNRVTLTTAGIFCRLQEENVIKIIGKLLVLRKLSNIHKVVPIFHSMHFA